MSSFTLCLYACHMVRVSYISMCSSCLHSRVHVSVLYASIKSLMYVCLLRISDVSLCLCNSPTYMPHDQWVLHVCASDQDRYSGLLGYYRRFIANFTLIAAPLTNLT